MRAFIIFRDRQGYAQLCLTRLMEAGLEPVVVDQGSTWPRATEWLSRLEATGVTVLRRGGGHPRGLWQWGPFNEARGGERCVVTDPDVVPADDCPDDWPERLSAILDRHPDVSKAGLGLKAYDLPAHYQRREQVAEWEGKFWANPVDGLGIPAYRAGIDTTLALYREGTGHAIDGIRTGHPYVADHLAWHEDLDNLDAEIAWYYEHAEPGIAHWTIRGKSTFGNLKKPGSWGAQKDRKRLAQRRHTLERRLPRQENIRGHVACLSL